MVAHSLEIPSGLRYVSGYSGAGPQQLLARACRAIEEGHTDTVLIVGGIADASVRRARQLGIKPLAPPTSPWSQGSSARAESPPLDRNDGGYLAEVAAGAGLPVAYFALVESAMNAGISMSDQQSLLGDLLGPFTDVAARRPELAWFPERRSATEIATPSEDNRTVAEPYTKLMCSFPTVDLAAAVVVARSEASSRLVVRPLALVTASENGPPSSWPMMDRSGALDRAVAGMLELTGITPSEIDLFDLYSCFPAAVQMASRAFGVAQGDTRQRTTTGGLPYFGGPGAAYSLHGVACVVEELRTRPQATGAVVGVGGMVTDFSVGLYGVSDEPYRDSDLGEITSNAVEIRPAGDGRAVVDAMTVLHDRHRGPMAAPIIARLPDGSRVGARLAEPSLASELSGTSLVGREVDLTTIAGKVVYEPN